MTEMINKKSDFVQHRIRPNDSKWSQKKTIRKREQPKEPSEQEILQIKRVTKVTKGGRQLRFTALVLVKEGKGIAFGLARGTDVVTAIRKAVSQAKKKATSYFLEAPRTIPYDFKYSFKATKIYFRPAPAGSGIIAGGAINLIFKYLGIHDVSAKIIGSNNKLNVVRCTFQALDKITKRKNNW